MKNRTKIMRSPFEFERMISNLSEQFSEQTGLPKSKVGAMRRLAKLEHRIKVNGVDFEII